MEKHKVTFIEEQKFRPFWLVLILLIIEIFLLTDLTISTNNGRNYSSLGLVFNIILTLFPAIILIGIYILDVKLVTKINNQGITVFWYPFKNDTNVISWKDLKSIDIISYSLVGYGWRFSPKYGTVNNVSGNIGIALTLINGSKYLVGTQKDQTLVNAAIALFR